MFDDLLDANRRYRATFRDPGLTGRAGKGIALLTCMDSRIDPLAILGLVPGDAKIIRNAGARVTDDSLRSLVLGASLLGVTRVCIMQHTDCAMVGRTDDEVRDRVGSHLGVDPGGWEPLTTPDHVTALRADLERLRSCPLLPADLEVGTFVYDVHEGRLVPVPVDLPA